jgi:hypothetical protein
LVLVDKVMVVLVVVLVAVEELMLKLHQLLHQLDGPQEALNFIIVLV